MPKIDLESVPQTNATGYPPAFADAVAGRWVRRVGKASGLRDFGASHVVLKPGAWSAQRHWHEQEDEFLVMLTGEAVLVDNTGRTPLHPGDMAAFPKNDGNGHCVVNEGRADCVFVVIGQGVNGPAHYPDIDLHVDPVNGYTHKDGTPY